MAFRHKQTSSEKPKRPPIIGFRATDEERAQIEAAAERAGLTVGSYVRSRALERPQTRAVRRPPVETAQLAKLLGMLGVLGGQIQALAQEHGADVGPAQLEETMAAFRDAAAGILLAIGKRPPRSARAP
jgi:hypothetical protein